MRILFAVPFLPRPAISIKGIVSGSESLSGSQSSVLLVADELSRRGHAVGLWVRGGQKTTDTGIMNYPKLEHALNGSWDRIVLASWEDRDAFEALKSQGIAPLLWTHVHVPRETLVQLESNALAGLVVVSDTARAPLMHSSSNRRIGRIYNPLNPFFAELPRFDAARYGSKRVVFTGFLGVNKGAHRVLLMWPEVKKLVPEARLVLVGSGKLYREDAEVGPLGFADPDFEEKYIQPIIARFGTLSEAGIELTGLMTPLQLRELYGSCALGFINFNWHEFTETFCCVGAEMLAIQLPIFSFAASALPETMGRTGGAILMQTPDLCAGAERVAEALSDPALLQKLGTAGREFVLSEYDLGRTASVWEKALAADARQLSTVSKGWNCRRDGRYFLERLTGVTGMGQVYRSLIDRGKSIIGLRQ